jgi:hypothetical protein
MSRSVKLDYDRLRNPGPITLYQCYECATLTPNPPINDVALCEQHQQENTP